MVVLASPSPDTIKLVEVPFSPVAVVNVLFPLSAPLIMAVNVPVAALYALSTVLVWIGVVVVYLLAVVVFKLAPALRGAEVELSVNRAHNFGDVPCAAVLSVMLFPLRLVGAAGVAFMVNVMFSWSSWAMVPGVPYALNSVVMVPTLAPVKFLSSVLPMVPAVLPSSATDVTLLLSP